MPLCPSKLNQCRYALLKQNPIHLVGSSIYLVSNLKQLPSTSTNWGIGTIVSLFDKMNERNKSRSRQRVPDLANGRHVQNHRHAEPCILHESTSNLRRSHMNYSSGGVNSFDLHRLPEHVDFYETTHYNQPNHEFAHHLPYSGNYGGNVVPFNEHGMRNYSAKDMTSCHFDSRPACIEAPFFPLPHYRGNGTPPTMEVGARHHLSVDVGRLHLDPSYSNFLLQRNYWGEYFQPPSSCTWLDRRSISSARGLPWSGPPTMLYIQGSNIIHGSPLELGNASLPSSNRGSANFSHSTPVAPRRHNLHPSQNIKRVIVYGVACSSSFLAASSRVRRDVARQHRVLSISLATLELANRLTGNTTYQSRGRNHVPDVTSRRRRESQENTEPRNRPSGIRIYWSQGRNHVPDVASIVRDVGLMIRRVDDVLIFEFPTSLDVVYNVESFIDRQSDMPPLEYDEISFAEIIAWSEHNRGVRSSSGLTEKDIICRLKTKRYCATRATINQEKPPPCIDQDNDSCIICQDEYEDNDRLATLECGHEYHVDCLKKWLLLKNLCPLCKSRALAVVPRKDR